MPMPVFSDIAVSQVTIAGPDAGDFQIKDDGCSGQTFAPGRSGTLGVIFKPAAPGSKQATLKIFSNDSLTPVYQVPLTGTALPAPDQPQPSPAAALPVFNDLQGHWAARDVTRLQGMGIVGGYPDGTFRPDQLVTRAEAAVLLVKALKLPPGTDQELLQFSDQAAVPTWARAAVAGSVREKLLAGFAQIDGDGMAVLATGQPVTRVELACLFGNAVKRRAVAVSPAPLTFADAASIPTGPGMALPFRFPRRYSTGIQTAPIRA